MKNLIKLFILLFSLNALYSCDKIEEGNYRKPFVRPETTKKIILEDWTGHTCGNCPDAAKLAAELDSTFEGNVIIIGVHAGDFAKTSPGNFYYDFRTTAGNQLESFFRFDKQGRPKGMVNRVGFNKDDATNTDHVLPTNVWKDIVIKELSKDPDAKITLDASYDTSSRKLTANISTQFISDLNGDYKLAVCIIEDGVIQYQKWFGHVPEDVADYVHKHVYRGAVNGTFGESIATGRIDAGKTVDVSYNYTLSSAWNAKNCKVVAYIYNGADYHIIQAEEASF